MSLEVCPLQARAQPKFRGWLSDRRRGTDASMYAAMEAARLEKSAVAVAVVMMEMVVVVMFQSSCWWVKEKRRSWGNRAMACLAVIPSHKSQVQEIRDRATIGGAKKEPSFGVLSSAQLR